MRVFGYWIASWWWSASYAIRPYDMLADRRRWFWQPPTPCQFSSSDREVARWFDIPVELLKRSGR